MLTKILKKLYLVGTTGVSDNKLLAPPTLEIVKGEKSSQSAKTKTPKPNRKTNLVTFASNFTAASECQLLVCAGCRCVCFRARRSLGEPSAAQHVCQQLAGSAKAAPSLFNIQPVAPWRRHLLPARASASRADGLRTHRRPRALRLLSTRAPACKAL